MGAQEPLLPLLKDFLHIYLTLISFCLSIHEQKHVNFQKTILKRNIFNTFRSAFRKLGVNVTEHRFGVSARYRLHLDFIVPGNLKVLSAVFPSNYIVYLTEIYFRGRKRASWSSRHMLKKTYVSPKFINGSTAPQCLRMWPYLKIGLLRILR